MKKEYFPFQEEPFFYTKGILSDLQGAWTCLRSSVVEISPSEIRDRLIFHIDEGMSWENVRNLDQMNKAIILISNIIRQEKLNEDITFWMQDVQEIFEEVMVQIKKGERI